MKKLFIDVPADLDEGVKAKATYVCDEDGCRFVCLVLPPEVITDEEKASEFVDLRELFLDATELYECEVGEPGEGEEDPDNAARAAFRWANRGLK